MEISRVGGGPWGQNCYVVVKQREAILIDPGGQAEEIISFCQRHGLSVIGIFNTHGHFDHIGAVQDLIDVYGVDFYISAREVPIMKSSNLLRFIFKSDEKVRVPKIFCDLDKCEDKIVTGGIEISLIPTPGHTPGGYSFLVEDHIFTGDTVLSNMPGSAELPGGNLKDLQQSLARLRKLPTHLILHPGHGPDRTLKQALDSAFNYLEAQGSE